MKNIRKTVVVIMTAAAALLLTGTAFAAAAADSGQGGPGEYLDKAGTASRSDAAEKGAADFDVKGLKAAQEAEKLVLVVGQEGSEIAVSYYEKNEQQEWKSVFHTEGVYGRNGGTWDKQEGDGKTPYGTYGINKAFGILDNPGCILPYTKVTENDYWVSDSSSSHYNRMVNTSQTEKDWNDAEHLIEIAPYYNYVLSLDYNEEAVPGKGSAIFVHCTAEDYTGSSGCVCIGEEEMKTLITRADDKMKVVIVPDKESLKEQ